MAAEAYARQLIGVVTLLGAGVADQLEDGRVLSGVGGQYNFVAQGHALHDARSVIILRSWRESGGEVSSNIVWEYGHCTIPRHLRDIVVTEYGIADLRGKTDRHVIEALLNITDSRFQTELIAQAQQVGKLPKDFQLQPRFADNSPERLQGIAARHPHLFPEYPLGSDFSAQEQDLLRALNWLKSKFKLTQIYELGKARDRAMGYAREALRQAAKEEVEHLAWTGRRIRELGGRPSVLNPLWYGGSLLLGVAAGLAGDRWNLGFLAETEHQVGAHLRSHLERLPEADSKSRAIVGQMYEDEIGHAQQAEALGAASLPQPLPQLMQVASKVMTTISYRL